MSWLVDNVNVLYVLLIIISAGLVVAWRFNQRVKFLLLAGVPPLVMILLYLLTMVWITDRAQIEQNVHEMADSVQRGNVDGVFKHISKDFKTENETTRETLYQLAQQSIKANQVNEILIRGFKVTELSRDQKVAKATFYVHANAGGEVRIFITDADFVLEGDRWLLKTVTFLMPGSNQKISVPGL
jgi:hypothetical protein